MLWLVTQDTYKLRMIGVVICIISIPATIYLPESPRLLAARGKTTELEAAMSRMAKVNRKEFALTADQKSLIEKRASEKIPNSSQTFGQIIVAPSFWLTIEAEVPDDID